MTNRPVRHQSGLYPKVQLRVDPDRWEHDNTLFTAVLMVLPDGTVVGCVISSLLSCGTFTDRFNPATCLSDMLRLVTAMFRAD